MRFTFPAMADAVRSIARLDVLCQVHGKNDSKCGFALEQLDEAEKALRRIGERRAEIDAALGAGWLEGEG